MRKHAAPNRGTNPLKALRIPALILAGLLILAVAIALPIYLFGTDPYEQLLTDGGIEPVECRTEDGTLYLTFAGDVEGILSCRNAVTLLRNSDVTPKKICWTLTEGEKILRTGTVENPDHVPAPETPRVETLNEEQTEIKLYFELTTSNLRVSTVKAEKAPEGTGKTVTVRINCSRDSARYYVGTARAAIRAINEEGGGVLRCNVFFCENDTPFAVASMDLKYGDTLLSALFPED